MSGAETCAGLIDPALLSIQRASPPPPLHPTAQGLTSQAMPHGWSL